MRPELRLPCESSIYVGAVVASDQVDEHDRAQRRGVRKRDMMADELARAYFERLKAAEQQIFELQLELARKDARSTSDVAGVIATSHDDEQCQDDEADNDNDDAQMVTCDCGIDLLAQMQENNAWQDRLVAERAKCLAIQSQVRNLRKQMARRDEKISSLTAQNVVQVEQEPIRNGPETS